MTNCSPAPTTIEDSKWLGRRVTVMGLGRHGGGMGAARFLAARGARVTISDAATAETLQDSLHQLGDLPIHACHLGRHDERDFRDTDCVIVNPAVRPDHPCLELARRSGVPISSEIELFLERCPARIVGVTGSNGKSTTATMLAAILTAGGQRNWLGGNIGGSLLGQLDQMRDDDWVVLELSSFQLAHLSPQVRLPELTVITSFAPNHLDWHGSLDAYRQSKQRLLRSVEVVLNTYDAALDPWRTLAPTRHEPWRLQKLPALQVPGQHNCHNAACAAAAAHLAGVSSETIRRALTAFRGLRHRIEFVADVAGRGFYNDSKSTSPAATMVALEAIEQPTWLLLGGVAKGTDFAPLAAATGGRVRSVAVFGQSRDEIAANFRGRADAPPVHRCETLDEAVGWCMAQSGPGEAILLSPACASFDQYRDFEDRGRHFEQLVRQMAGFDTAGKSCEVVADTPSPRPQTLYN